MKMLHVVSTVLLIGVTLFAAVAVADEVFLLADFDDKTVDQPIGTGGAAVNEPAEVEEYISAIVRDSPMSTPCLEIQDIHEYNGQACFQFLGDEIVTGGMVDVAFNLWFETFEDGENCNITICNLGVSHQRFAELLFSDGGVVWLHYGVASSAGEIGSYAIGRPFRVILEFDMDAGTFDVWLDGARVVTDLAHDLTGSGIGAVCFCTVQDADLVGRYYVDNILVGDFFRATDGEPQSWGRIKTMYR